MESVPDDHGQACGASEAEQAETDPEEPFDPATFLDKEEPEKPGQEDAEESIAEDAVAEAAAGVDEPTPIMVGGETEEEIVENEYISAVFVDGLVIV